ncbi:MAG: CAP domain-containing protein [Bdellovibrionales bacterium]|nr:CAP domain-containing protein [Bdellovibrionales bacterium]
MAIQTIYCVIFSCCAALLFPFGILAEARPCPVEWVQQAIDATNIYRVEHGSAPLELHSGLTQAAANRAHTLTQRGELSHEGWLNSVADFREPGTSFAENIAYGYSSGLKTSRMWYGSVPHKANMLEPKFTSTGIGCFLDHTGIPWWAQLFKN